MDLVSISRRYKNVKRILIFILLLIIIVYICLIVNKCLENSKKERIYQSYQKIYDTLNINNEQKNNQDPNKQENNQEQIEKDNWRTE